MRLKLPFFKKSEFKTVAENNRLFESLFRNYLHSGTGEAMPDDPVSQVDQGYAGNSDWYSIVNKMAVMGSSVPIKLMDFSKGKGEEVFDHELLDIIEYPNNTQTFQEIETGWWIYMTTIGNAFIYTPLIEFGKDAGKTTEMYMMPAPYTEVLCSNDWMNPVQGYVLNWDTQYTFEPNTIYHSRLFDPRFNNTSKFYGMSPLVAAANVLSKNTEADKMQLKQFENQSPPYIVQRKPEGANMLNGGFTTLQKEGFEKQLKNYGEKYKGGSPLVTTIPIEVIRLGVDLATLNTIESSKDGMRRLCSVLNMPSILFNDNEGSTFNNVDSAMKMAWQHGIKPLKAQFVSALNRHLIKPVEAYKGLKFVADYSDIAELQENLKDKVEWMTKAYYTPNEIREATGKDAINDELMNQPFMSLNQRPLSDIKTQLDAGITDDYTDDQD